MGPPAPPWHNWGSSILHKRRSPVGTPELSGPRHSPEKARRRWLAPTSSILLKVEEITQIQYSELLCSMWKISMATVRKLSYNSKCLTYVIKSPVSSKWALHTIPGPLIPPFPRKPSGGSSIQVALLLPSLSVALAYYQKSPSHTRQALLFRFVYLQILKIPLLLFQGPALHGPCNNWPLLLCCDSEPREACWY